MSEFSVALEAPFQRGGDCSGLSPCPLCSLLSLNGVIPRIQRWGVGKRLNVGGLGLRERHLVLVTFPQAQDADPASPTPGLTWEGKMVKGKGLSSHRHGFKMSSTLPAV